MAEKKYVTTKYGTRINVSGLDPDQVKKVLSISQDKGAYGTKGANLADTLRKKNQGAAKPVVTNPVSGVTNLPGDAGKIKTPINDKTGQIDTQATLDQAPGLVGTNLQEDVTKARDSAYSYITQHYGDQKAQEIAAKKQELAQSGIPIDTRPDSLYSKSMAQIDQKYQQLDDQAKNQAIGAGNEILGTESGVSTNAYNAFMNSIIGMSDIELKKYGIDKSAAIEKIKADAAMKSASRRPSGGGGGDTSPIISTSGFGVSNG